MNKFIKIYAIVWAFGIMANLYDINNSLKVIAEYYEDGNPADSLPALEPLPYQE